MNSRDPNGLVNRVFRIPVFVQGSMFPFLADRFPGMALKVREYTGSDDEEEPIGALEREEVDSDVLASR